MCIVTAGMHYACVLRAVRHLVGFGNGQGIHIRAEGNYIARCFVACYKGYEAVIRHPLVLQPELVQFACNKCRGLGFVK